MRWRSSARSTSSSGRSTGERRRRRSDGARWAAPARSRAGRASAAPGSAAASRHTHATGSADEASHQPEHFDFDAESEKALAAIVKRYPPGKQASAVIPALYLVQRQMGRQTGSAWVPRMAHGRGGAAARHAADPRLRGRHLLLDVQHQADRPLPPPGLRHDALLAARLGRGAARVQGCGAPRGLRRDQRGRDVHPDRGGVPRRLRERADPAGGRRLLRGPRLRQHRGAARRAAARRASEAGLRSPGARPARRRAGR